MNLSKLKLLIIVGMGISFCVQAPPSVETFIVNRVNESLSPYTITNCSKISYYPHNSTNEISITNVSAGDSITAIISMPDPDPTYTGNIVGYINIHVPPVLPPSNFRMSLK